jgi:hypothetical protein
MGNREERIKEVAFSIRILKQNKYIACGWWAYHQSNAYPIFNNNDRSAE